MSIDELSLLTTPVLLYSGADVVSRGTGFYYQHTDGNKEVVFLVTNIHVLTGHSPLAGKPPMGDSIEFQLHRSRDNPGDVKTIRFQLFTRDQQPTWLTGAVPDADLAVIPIQEAATAGCFIQCIGSAWLDSGNLRVRPTSAVTLVGYPYGFYDKANSLPIFKTGNVASEPSVDFEGKPLLLVDVAAFPGMSGSPVFAVQYGAYEDESGSTQIGSARRFLGIYASMEIFREHRYLEQLVRPQAQATVSLGIVNEVSLQIGNVWKGALVRDTIAAVNIQKYQAEVLSRI